MIKNLLVKIIKWESLAAMLCFISFIVILKRASRKVSKTITRTAKVRFLMTLFIINDAMFVEILYAIE